MDIFSLRRIDPNRVKYVQRVMKVRHYLLTVHARTGQATLMKAYTSKPKYFYLGFSISIHELLYIMTHIHDLLLPRLHNLLQF